MKPARALMALVTHRERACRLAAEHFGYAGPLSAAEAERGFSTEEKQLIARLETAFEEVSRLFYADGYAEAQRQAKALAEAWKTKANTDDGVDVADAIENEIDCMTPPKAKKAKRVRSRA